MSPLHAARMEILMTRYVNRWTAMFGWVALMAIVWTLFVPKGLSAGSFTLLLLTGPVLLISASVLWGAHRPSPSVREMRATLELSERPKADAHISA
jgi:hypothetical protein